MHSKQADRKLELMIRNETMSDCDPRMCVIDFVDKEGVHKDVSDDGR